MKKILLLGGSAQQVIAIETAKKLGYYTVLCDYLPDNPGQFSADKFYLVSTTDKEAVLKVAMEEEISGIVAYSSDPAAPTAAYVAEKMELPGIPYETAHSFCEKHLFRKFLEDNGFNVPKAVALDKNASLSALSGMSFPLIIKPTDSSGSKGVTVIEAPEEFESALSYAREFSRNGVQIAEEFIQRDHPHVIEAEIFAVDGEVKVWGLMNTVRDKYTNPLLPAAYGYPLSVSDDRFELVKSEVSRLVKCSNVKYGAFNIEMIITRENKLYFLDAGPRNGGNILPEFIGGIKNQNLVEATIYAAMGEYEKLKDLSLDGKEGGFWGMSVLHTASDGILDRVEYSELAKKCLFREEFFIKPGSEVHSFKVSRNAVGLSLFKFPDEETRDRVLGDFVGEEIKIILKEQ